MSRLQPSPVAYVMSDPRWADENKGIQLVTDICEELANAHFVERLRTLVGEIKAFPFACEAHRLWLDYFTARLLELEVRGGLAEQGYEAVASHAQAEPLLKAYALCNLGRLLAEWQYLGNLGGVAKAARVLGESLNFVPLDRRLIESLFNFAHLYQYLGKWDESFMYLEKARQFYAEQQNDYGLAYTYVQFMIMYMGHLKEIFESEGKARAVLDELPQYSYVRASVNAFACMRLYAGQYAESEKLARESLTTLQRLGDTRGCLEPMRWLSMALAMQGKYEEANAYCAEHLNITQKMGEYYIKDMGHGLQTRGIVLTRQGQY